MGGAPASIQHLRGVTAPVSKQKRSFLSLINFGASQWYLSVCRVRSLALARSFVAICASTNHPLFLVKNYWHHYSFVFAEAQTDPAIFLFCVVCILHLTGVSDSSSLLYLAIVRFDKPPDPLLLFHSQF